MGAPERGLPNSSGPVATLPASKPPLSLHLSLQGIVALRTAQLHKKPIVAQELIQAGKDRDPYRLRDIIVEMEQDPDMYATFRGLLAQAEADYPTRD